jgi:hypothetical protein
VCDGLAHAEQGRAQAHPLFVGEEDRRDVVRIGEDRVHAQGRGFVERIVAELVALEHPVVELAGEPARIFVLLVLVDQKRAEVQHREQLGL